MCAETTCISAFPVRSPVHCSIKCGRLPAQCWCAAPRRPAQPTRSKPTLFQQHVARPPGAPAEKNRNAAQVVPAGLGTHSSHTSDTVLQRAAVCTCLCEHIWRQSCQWSAHALANTSADGAAYNKRGHVCVPGCVNTCAASAQKTHTFCAKCDFAHTQEKNAIKAQWVKERTRNHKVKFAHQCCAEHDPEEKNIKHKLSSTLMGKIHFMIFL